MTDENAFGVLLSYFDVEDDEYGLEREQFVERFEAFRRAVRVCLESPPGEDVRGLDVGHALYLEVAEGDHEDGLIGWLQRARSRLGEQGFRTAAVLSYGSRWDNEQESPDFGVERFGRVQLVTFSNPSEPLRRALNAETACHGDEELGETGWGPGLYLDTEAVEALGKKPKNEPTTLVVAGATFYRAGS